MKVSGSRLGIFAFCSVAILYIVVSDLSRTSPGVLAAVHQREDALTGWGSCSQCHGGWFGNMTSACLACHADVGKDIDNGRGLHGALGAEKAADCARCHSEHHGEGFPMVNKQSFLAAGVKDKAGFAHELVGFEMDGKHLELQCAECHEHAEAKVLRKGERRFMGLSKNCFTCHADPHKGEMGQSCEKCHSQTSFVQSAPSDHDRFLALVGPHAKSSCRDCHGKKTLHSLEAYSRGETPKARGCANCHDSPHASTFISGVAKQSEKTAEGSCTVCHLPDHMKFTTFGVTVTPRQHAASGFALDVPHDKAACADCHAPSSGAGAFAARHPGRKANECISCHQDPHAGQFNKGPFAVAGCVACHDRHQFEPHAFDVEKHERASFPLTGVHRETDCNACHEVPTATPKEKTPRRFRGTKGQCDACHADAHDGFFDPFIASLSAAERKRGAAGSCAHCHETDAFSNVPAARFDHAKWTGFPLRGSHQQMACEACHRRAAEPDETGRRFGRAARQFNAAPGRAAACSTCHHDTHKGRFNRRGVPRKVDGRSDCARCHNETSFRTMEGDFDHGRWTRFKLDGAHGKTGCSTCHVPLQRPDAHGRTWGHAKGRRCASCHKDPHAKQFKVKGRTSCERCHRSAGSFADLVFNHDRDSRFKLDEAHRGLACDSCHKKVRIGTVVLRRYRPMGRKCADCHGVNHEPFRRRRGRKR